MRKVLSGKCKLLFLSLFLLQAGIIHAQSENIWVFGDHAGIDFNGSNPVPLQTSIQGFGEANASVCNENGQLLFYTEGSKVWDRYGVLMANGADLLPLVSTDNNSTTASTSQGALIVPMPGSNKKYYIFSLTSLEQNVNKGRLYYSVVDMNLNGGLGNIITGQKGIFVDSNLTERMTAVVGNRCNIWLLTCSQFLPQIKSYEIDGSGINNPVTSNVPQSFGLTGTIVASANRKKIAITNAAAPVLYDFNASTGVVSNPIILSGTLSYGACFSSNNSKLYIYELSTSSIYQYDLISGDAATILTSKTYLGSSAFTHLKLAPNGRIYFNSGSVGLDYWLGAINAPDLAGTACSYTPTAIQLSENTGMYAGFPNVVPVIIRDTFMTSRIIQAACFANVNTLNIHANNDTAGWDYTWNTGSTDALITTDTPGIYWISYHSPPCQFHVDTFHVQFPNGMLPSFILHASCENDANGSAYAYTYPGDTVGYHYTWYNNAGDTLSRTDTLQQVPSGNYTVRITTAHCDTTLSLYLPEESHQVSFRADSIICMGDALIFTNTSDSHFTRFDWDFGDSAETAITSPVHTYPHPGSYTVTLTGTGAVCTDTAFATIVADSMLAGSFRAERDSICTGQAITFQPQTDSTTLALHWAFGDGREMGMANENIVQHAYDKPGIIPVTLKAQFRACPDISYTDTVYVYPLPLVNLGPDSVLCLNGSPILLHNLQPDPELTFHNRWNTGDTAASLKVVHPGTYSLTVSAEPLGCSTTETIIIRKDCYTDIPNAFTPNGDGVNDYFYPRQLLSRSVTKFRMQVLNRWGQLVFETTRTDGRGWDGKFNGKDQPSGVYIYLIDVEIDNIIPEYYRGNVTLVR